MIRNRFVSPVFFFSLAPFWSPAMASDWVELGVDDDGGTRLLDKASISRDGPVARAWTKVQLAQPTLDDKSGKQISAVSVLVVTDCLGTFVGMEKGRMFDASGALVIEQKTTVYTVPKPISEGPFLKEMVQLMCAPDNTMSWP